MEIPGSVAIFGLGRTGQALVKFLSRLGKKIVVIDEKGEEELTGALSELQGVEFERRLRCRGGPELSFDAPLVLFSPGIRTDHPLLVEARRQGRRVMGELEFASRFVKEPVIAVTGTNGKTTVVTLLGQILKRAYGNVFVGGNIGRPLTEYLLDGGGARLLCLEVSSFQLESIETFRPSIAVLLNLTEDHLDRYEDFQAYRKAKFRIFENQKEHDFAITRSDLRDLGAVRPKILPFSLVGPFEEGAFFEDGFLCVRLGGREFRYRREACPLLGPHNTENLLSAILAAHLVGVDRSVIEEVISTFRGLPHRIEKVREIEGVVYYNDSKATNVDATVRAIECFEGTIVLIAGGKDKGGSFGALLPYLPRLKALILFGEAKGRIERELGGHVRCFLESGLPSAVKRARDVAERGDVVLFSPMCSSFDMFRNYEERGEAFRKIVEEM